MHLNTSLLTRRWQELPPGRMRELQLQRLRHFLRTRVLPFSSHYRSLFAEDGIDPSAIRTADDLAALPTTSKSDLLGPPGGAPPSRDFVLAPDPASLRRRPSTILRALLRGRDRARAALEHEYRPIFMTSTTGRSTDPVPFFYTGHDLDNLALTGRRLMEICRSDPAFRHLNLFPFAPHLAFWQAHYAGIGFNTFTLGTGGGRAMGTSGNVRLLGKVDPDALIGMPTFIYHVLQEAAEGGLHCTKIKRIVLGGEKAPAGIRRKLRSLCAELGSPEVDVMATYGFTEAKAAWPECPAPAGAETGGYHLYPDLGIVEVVDPDSGRPVAEGEPGEIVYTPLDSRGSVVLRYRTGDLISGGISYEPCPHCRRRVPRLLGRISRVSDVRRLKIDKVKGTLVNFNELEHVLDDMDEIGAWQIEIRKRNDDPLECDLLVVHLNVARRVGRERIAGEVRRRIRAATELSPNDIQFHDAGTLRSMHGVGRELKEQKVVDHRPAGAPAIPLTPNHH